jgi:hypothetical protein
MRCLHGGEGVKNGFKLHKYILNPFTAEVAIMRLLGSAPKSPEMRPEKEEQSDWLDFQLTDIF